MTEYKIAGDDGIAASNKSDGESQTVKWTRKDFVLLVSVLAAHFVMYTEASLLVPFFPNEAMDKGISTSHIGLIFSSYHLVMVVMSLIYGSYVS